jgi:hypothetical protein
MGGAVVLWQEVQHSAVRDRHCFRDTKTWLHIQCCLSSVTGSSYYVVSVWVWGWGRGGGWM